MKKRIKIKSADSKLDAWKDDEKLLCKNKICKFNVQYLGAMEVKEPKHDDAMYKNAMITLLEKKKRTGELRISVYSIVFQDRTANALILDQTLKKLMMCSVYTTVPYSFFYIAEDSATNICQLYGFISCKEVSHRIVNAIEYAMQLFTEIPHDNYILPKSSQVIQDESDTIFKQVSLVEKYQDPQSSIIIHNTPVKCSRTFTNLMAIPRPKGSKTIERKSSEDSLPKLSQGDMFKSTCVSSKSVDSTRGLSVKDTPGDTFSKGAFSNDFDWCNFTSAEKLQRIHHINEAFYEKRPNVQGTENLFNRNIEPYTRDTGNVQKSRYDYLKNLNGQAALGWSPSLVNGNEHNQLPTKSYDAFLDEIIIPNFANSNLWNTKTQNSFSSKN